MIANVSKYTCSLFEAKRQKKLTFSWTGSVISLIESEKGNKKLFNQK